jgi:predicted secreted protein
MSVVNGLAVYFVIWWVVLFAVLPWGIRSQAEEGSVVAGSDPGAPARAPLLRIVLMTSLLAAVVFGALWGAFSFGLIGLGPRP